MKLIMLFFSLLIFLYSQVEVLGLPQGLSANYLGPKPVAPLPAKDKYPSLFSGDHGSNAPDDDILLRNASVCVRNPGYAYDISSRICSETRTQAHCGKNMIFYKYSYYFGACDCNSASKVPLFLFKDNQSSKSRCYYIYTQGYCDNGYWLEADYMGGPRCSQNRCYSVGTSFGQPALASRDRMPEYVPLNSNGGPCTRLFANSSLHCNSKEVVTFVGNNKYASCSRDYVLDFPCST